MEAGDMIADQGEGVIGVIHLGGIEMKTEKIEHVPAYIYHDVWKERNWMDRMYAPKAQQVRLRRMENNPDMWSIFGVSPTGIGKIEDGETEEEEDEEEEEEEEEDEEEEEEEEED